MDNRKQPQREERPREEWATHEARQEWAEDPVTERAREELLRLQSAELHRLLVQCRMSSDSIVTRTIGAYDAIAKAIHMTESPGNDDGS